MKCTICNDKFDVMTTIPVRMVKNKMLEIEVCDYCRQQILMELMKQFILEQWNPK